MRRFPGLLSRIIEKSGLKLNAISKASGISHTYLTKLMNGRVNRPGKDKIAGILLALNRTFVEINDILAEYDYQPLDTLDIPEILRNNQKRRIEGTTLPLFSHIYMELILSPMERQGGAKVLVKDRPSALFMPEDLYLRDEFPYDTEREGQARRFQHELTLALLDERKSIFEENVLRGCRFETYICRRCLEEYLKRVLAPARSPSEEEHHRRIAAYFGNAIAAMQARPEQHRTWIVDRCAHLHYQLQDADGLHPKVFSIGKKPHAFDNPHDSLTIQGFASDAPSTIEIFRQETERARLAVSPEFERDYPQSVIDHLTGFFDRAGLLAELRAEVDRASLKEDKAV